MTLTIPSARANIASDPATSSADAYRMIIRDLTIMAGVGVYAHEREAPQPIRLNLDLKVRRGGGALGVVDYHAIVKGITGLMTRGHIELVEDVGEQIIDFCMSDPCIEEMTVRVEKMDAIKETASVGIEMHRAASR